MPYRLRKSKPPRLIPVEDPGHLGFDYTIRLSSRKTAAIEIRSGKVVVAAPHRATQRELKHWVEDKADWIRAKLTEQAAREDEIPQPSFADGERWPYLGELLELKLVYGGKPGIRREGSRLWVTLSNRSRKPTETQIRQALENWYQQQAQIVLTEKTDFVCRALKRPYQGPKLRRTKTKWGHCTAKGEIQYNWLIMQAPEAVVNYLVVHECCHLIHHNHSRAFWDLVGQLYPGYKPARQWLKDKGHRLVL
ncbi:M48 family metallopeptidase [Pseudomaricurvus alkylphenolicus]|uniref:M48 family metallopeptidase n=1 Tax=Pseudomaricurvus alkylphenolicus TaxID=1306991 RepID=UPI0014234036|nr:SprT family zinc-dependent metalloprotease [Pseudomaricurvus alkylphenolicus]NIB43364.1 M48 family metallopeptidase [Pseudomaricurvus alkylphenolicus]